jgi:hypothetical protein
MSDLSLVLALFDLSISQTSEDAEKPGRYHMIERHPLRYSKFIHYDDSVPCQPSFSRT